MQVPQAPRTPLIVYGGGLLRPHVVPVLAFVSWRMDCSSMQRDAPAFVPSLLNLLVSIVTSTMLLYYAAITSIALSER
jgi:hypothetical protein